ncbi:hypothetical protein V6N13_040500 [Hibiscus sabdariffa]|uniref:Uncharacterized protein n=1 Tax=Hibiscus sabdariffa TaxID=183260 RepID=A0ABR2R8M3_9ROSI
MKDDEFLKQVHPNMSREDRSTVIEAIQGSGNGNKALRILDKAYVAPGQETYHQNFRKMIVPTSNRRRGQSNSQSRSEVQSISRSRSEIQATSRSRSEVQSNSRSRSDIQRHSQSHSDVQRASRSRRGRIQ